MLCFLNDYAQGAHPKVLQALIDTNALSLPGYGEDPLCAQAKEKLRAFCGAPDADVFFVTGGTQVNLTALSALLKRYEAAVCPVTGHINTHEAGAIEYTGHKVVGLPAREGKLAAETLEGYLAGFYADETHSHQPYPGVLYLSHPTELGTLYTRAELRALSALCRRYGLRLYLDGARLGYGLASPATDLTIGDLAACCDAFSVGGTKLGALCGEALIFPRHGAPAHFDTMTKQQGAMLAKGRLLGAQFGALFTDGLYLEIGRHALTLAGALKEGLLAKGVPLFADSPTNQQFFILENDGIARLREQVSFNLWEPVDGTRSAVRFVTGWASTRQDVEALIKLL